MPTYEFLQQAQQYIMQELRALRPELLAAFGAVEHEIKHDTSVVTALDIKTEKHLRERLAKLAPDFGFAGEETGANYDQRTFWLVDPIDGTEWFVRGMPFVTNMVALIHEGQPILSVIYNFVLDECYSAIKGHGATMNGTPIHVSDRAFDRSYIIMYGKRGDADCIDVFGKLMTRTRGTPHFHASGYEYTAMARGIIDGCISYHRVPKLWDIAPGVLLLQEAGGHIANISKDTYDYRNADFIAGNPHVFEGLAQFLAENSA